MELYTNREYDLVLHLVATIYGCGQWDDDQIQPAQGHRQRTGKTSSVFLFYRQTSQLGPLVIITSYRRRLRGHQNQQQLSSSRTAGSGSSSDDPPVGQLIEFD